jgi:translocation protein SEC63
LEDLLIVLSLTDEQVRKNYMQYGHPDGKQDMSLGIALPKWIVEEGNMYAVLGFYGILFGVMLPYFVVSCLFLVLLMA